VSRKANLNLSAERFGWCDEVRAWLVQKRFFLDLALYDDWMTVYRTNQQEQE